MTGPTVLVSKTGALGRIHLNRPEALNSLTPEMIRLIDAGLDRFEDDASVHAVALTGEGGKAMCAGGDIKFVWRTGRSDPQQALSFWAEEYRLDARIARFAKPWVAVMDGLVMGGGAGLAIHGAHRIVTETTKFAMPETGIGYFPDVGSTYALARSPDEMGTWIGLTGAVIGASDVLAAGMADVQVPKDRIAAVLDDLAQGRPVAEALQAEAVQPGPSDLRDNAGLLRAALAGEDVAAMLDRLAAIEAPFARRTLDLLRAKSPSSLVLALHLIRLARGSASLEASLDDEFAANALILSQDDFYEGIRAAVIDKDKAPKWSPATLAEVDAHALIAAIRPQPSLFGARRG
ncbi:enoyl-CoA hydratase/isomerase family protein [bacterium]|nr:enoyl-CoA hydratase/isomerase family protein [bacterium]